MYQVYQHYRLIIQTHVHTISCWVVEGWSWCLYFSMSHTIHYLSVVFVYSNDEYVMSNSFQGKVCKLPIFRTKHYSYIYTFLNCIIRLQLCYYQLNKVWYLELTCSGFMIKVHLWMGEHWKFVNFVLLREMIMLWIYKFIYLHVSKLSSWYIHVKVWLFHQDKHVRLHTSWNNVYIYFQLPSNNLYATVKISPCVVSMIMIKRKSAL